MFSERVCLNNKMHFKTILYIITKHYVIIFSFLFFFIDASVRLLFINHIPDILKRCQELSLEQKEYYLIYDALIDIIFLFLKDPDPQVRLNLKNYHYFITHGAIK